jgi:perosamine synthetase
MPKIDKSGAFLDSPTERLSLSESTMREPVDPANAPKTIRVPFSRPRISSDERSYLDEFLRSNAALPEEVILQFEHRFAKAVNCKYALATNSRSAALHLAMLAAGIGPGDEVIVPNFTSMAAVFAVVNCGAQPIPVDADETWTIDITQISRHVNDRTRAIVVAHVYGHPCRIDETSNVARDHNLILIEDASDALGATINGHPVGGLGDLGCHSFDSEKIVTTGEGGMLTTNNPDYYNRARWKRDMCFGDGLEERFLHKEPGYEYRLSGLQAALGLGQMRHIEDNCARKTEIADRYNRRLANVAGITRPPAAAWVRNAYSSYGILLETAKFGADRPCVQTLLEREGIETRRFFGPAHLQPFLGRRRSEEFPVSTCLFEDGLLLPSFVGLSDATVDHIVDILADIHLSRCKGR